jgi:homoserine kinase
VPDALRVTVPASSANLGPGFDCLAVALDLRNTVEVRETGSTGVRVHLAGEGAETLDRGAQNLVVRAFAATGASPDGLEFTLSSSIPLARGLGSSAAAIAAGIVAGAAWLGREGEDHLPLATRLEGHPDNVAAALLGGLTVAWDGAAGPRALRLSDRVHGALRFAVVVPRDEVPTQLARAALPAHVPHADAAHTAGRAALLVAALEEGRLDLVADALADRLHEPYRATLTPVLGQVRARLGTLPALGATLSGAGPTVLVWCEAGSEERVAAALDGVSGARAFPCAVAAEGARVTAASTAG